MPSVSPFQNAPMDEFMPRLASPEVPFWMIVDDTANLYGVDELADALLSASIIWFCSFNKFIASA
jgi:hypothetical protein